MKKVAFYTLGCKVNQYETDAMKGLFENKGYELVDFHDEADYYIVNSCTVTENSSKKSKQIINRIRREHPFSKVVVTGCMAEEAKQGKIKLNNVDLIVGTANKEKIVETTAATSKVTSIGDFLGFLKTIDLDSLSETVSSLQRVLGVFGDLTNKNADTIKQEYKPRPLYKHFDD